MKSKAEAPALVRRVLYASPSTGYDTSPVLSRNIPSGLRGNSLYILIGCLIGGIGLIALVSFAVWDRRRIRRKQNMPYRHSSPIGLEEALRSAQSSDTSLPKQPEPAALPEMRGSRLFLTLPATIKGNFKFSVLGPLGDLKLPTSPSPVSPSPTSPIARERRGRSQLPPPMGVVLLQPESFMSVGSEDSPITPQDASRESKLTMESFTYSTSADSKMAMVAPPVITTSPIASSLGHPPAILPSQLNSLNISRTHSPAVEMVGAVALEDHAEASEWYDGSERGSVHLKDAVMVDVYISFPWSDQSLHLRVPSQGASAAVLLGEARAFFGCGDDLALYVSQDADDESLVDDTKLARILTHHDQIPQIELWALPAGFASDAMSDDVVEIQPRELPGLTARSNSWMVYPGQEAELTRLVFAPEKQANPFAAYFAGMSPRDIEVFGGFRSKDQNDAAPYKKEVLEQIIQIPLH